MKPKWFKNYLAYTMSKYGMSMCTLGMSAEFAKDQIAINSLWPKTTIATAAIKFNFEEIYRRMSRTRELLLTPLIKLLPAIAVKLQVIFSLMKMYYGVPE